MVQEKKKAEVIIANPNGLHCDGCGTINATRSTMTTGNPLPEDGRVTGFQVEKGKMVVSGKGLIIVVSIIPIFLLEKRKSMRAFGRVKLTVVNSRQKHHQTGRYGTWRK